MVDWSNAPDTGKALATIAQGELGIAEFARDGEEDR